MRTIRKGQLLVSCGPEGDTPFVVMSNENTAADTFIGTIVMSTGAGAVGRTAEWEVDRFDIFTGDIHVVTETCGHIFKYKKEEPKINFLDMSVRQILELAAKNSGEKFRLCPKHISVK